MTTSQPADVQALSEELIQLWRRFLKKDVSATADFFEMGGDSLTAIRMIMEVQSTYEVEIDVETFFEEPSVAKLASILLRRSEPPGAP